MDLGALGLGSLIDSLDHRTFFSQLRQGVDLELEVQETDVWILPFVKVGDLKNFSHDPSGISEHLSHLGLVISGDADEEGDSLRGR